MKTNALYKWFYKAEMEERHKLAEKVGISYVYLHHLVAGRRQITAEMAIRIEAATREMNKKDAKIDVIEQPSICQACSVCPYAKK